MGPSHAQQRYAALLRTAEAGVDDIERLLGVARMMLSFCTDMLCNRSDKEPALTLDDILETHNVNTFPVGTAGTLAPADASVHEICSRDEQIYFQVCFSKTQPGLPSGGKPLAALQMVLQPDAQCKSSRFGNSKAVKVKLCGHCMVHFEAAQETYMIELPSIFIKDLQTPLKTCGLSGKLSISCAASRLGLKLTFEAKHSVIGEVVRQSKAWQQVVARLTGRWSDQVKVAMQTSKSKGPDLQGILFDNHEDWSCAEPSVDLQHPASMRLAGLWLCIKDSLHYSTQLPASFHTSLGSKTGGCRTGQLRFGLEYNLTTPQEDSLP